MISSHFLIVSACSCNLIIITHTRSITRRLHIEYDVNGIVKIIYLNRPSI